MGFSYHYFTQRKLDEISKYNIILRDNSLDSSTRSMLVKERTSIINKNRAILDSTERKTRTKSFLFWMSFTWIFLVLIALTPYLLKRQNYAATSSEINYQVFGVIVILLLLEVIIYFIAAAVSMYVTGVYLFLVNTFVQIVFLVFIFWLTTRNKKKY